MWGDKDKRDKARPLPEILDGSDWEVRNSNDNKLAYIDFEKREFVVPFQESPEGELVRAHEAMHVKISPSDKGALNVKDVEFVTLQSVEDCRIWQGLRMCDIPTDKAHIYSDKELRKIFEENKNLQHPQRLADAAFAFSGCSEEGIIRELVDAMNPMVLPIVDKVKEKYFTSAEKDNYLPPWEDVVEASQELVKEIKKLPVPPECPDDASGQGPKGKGSKELTQSFVPGKSDKDGQEKIAALSESDLLDAKTHNLPIRSEGYYSKPQSEFQYSEFYRDAGVLKQIIRPRFDKAIRFKTTSSTKMTASDEGCIPTRMHRYATDMRLFSRKGKRRAGAAVLIDVSGSMSLSLEEVEAIIHQCPASIIGVYSGNSGGGNLRIVAESGRYSSKLHTGMPGSNIIDLPSLQWLSKRKEKKKIWISDGWVTGIMDGNLSGKDLRKIINLLKDHKIDRVGNVRNLIQSGQLIDRSFDDGHTIGESFRKGS